MIVDHNKLHEPQFEDLASVGDALNIVRATLDQVYSSPAICDIMATEELMAIHAHLYHRFSRILSGV